jgi:TolA-binding protein
MGRAEQKINGLNAIISADAGDYVDDAVFELGNTYVSRERYQDARTQMQKYLEKYPGGEHSIDALSQLGLIYQNLGDNTAALRYYKQVVDKAPGSPQARAAMIAVRSIYVDMNDVDSYFAFATASGMETDVKVVERDSLAYTAAERVYLSNNVTRGADALKDYLVKYPRGAFRPNALYYLADSHIRMDDNVKAIESLSELSEMYYNPFTVRGLEKLSSLAYTEKRYAQAAAAYKKLALAAVNPETVEAGWNGYLRSAKAIGDDAQIMAAADDVLAAKGVSENVAKQAKSMKAGALMRGGDKAGALTLYRDLAGESKTAEGAEASYYVIESLFDQDKLDEAEAAILEFAGQNTPHSYWLGRSFLILGDIYAKKGDNFQARATLQSIVDGYSPADDGVIEAARERIDELK